MRSSQYFPFFNVTQPILNQEELDCKYFNIVVTLSVRFGRATEVQGLHSLMAAFEDEADRRFLFYMLG
jgi:hypothetical protein